MEETVLTVDRITKVYRRYPWSPPASALDALSLAVPGGQIYGLVGLNGAGKSTANKIILGFLHPTAGEARILGRPSTSPDARRALGYLPENLVLDESLTGREIVELAADLSGILRGSRDETVARILEKVGMAPAAGRLLREYSRGMRQRIGIAQALVHDPRLLILDEPFGGLDPVGRLMLKALVRDARDRSAAVLLTTHQLLEAGDLCDVIGILDRGRLLGEWPVKELLARRPDRNLEKVFIDLVADACGGQVPDREAQTCPTS